MKIKKLAIGAVAVATSVGLAFGGASAANADPIGAPADRPVRVVGSDTSQFNYTGLSQVLLSGGLKYISSWDAVGTSPIKTWSGGTTIKRPNGSSDGINALRAAVNGTGYANGSGGTATLNRGDVNAARSSNVQSWNNANTLLTHITSGVDALTWATQPGSRIPQTIPVGVPTDPTTTLTLRNIYAGNVTSYTIPVGQPGAGTVIPLRPLLPQAGSGTRSFFTALLGGNVSAAIDNVAGVPIQENGDDALTTEGSILPFSVGSWVAQRDASILNAGTAYGTSIVDNRSGAELRRTNASIAPLNSSGRTNATNPIKRPLFTVVATDSLNSADPDYIAQLGSTFVGGSATAYTASSPLNPSVRVYQDFGFLGGTAVVDPDANPGTNNSITYTVGAITATQAGVGTVNLTTN